MALEWLNTHILKTATKFPSHRYTHYTKINSTWIRDLKCRKKKLLQENIGENLSSLGFDDDFLDIPLKLQSVQKTWKVGLY